MGPTAAAASGYSAQNSHHNGYVPTVVAGGGGGGGATEHDRGNENSSVEAAVGCLFGGGRRMNVEMDLS